MANGLYQLGNLSFTRGSDTSSAALEDQCVAALCPLVRGWRHCAATAEPRLMARGITDNALFNFDRAPRLYRALALKGWTGAWAVKYPRSNDVCLEMTFNFDLGYWFWMYWYKIVMHSIRSRSTLIYFTEKNPETKRSSLKIWFCVAPFPKHKKEDFKNLIRT